MTNDPIASKLDDLETTLRTEFARVDHRFNDLDTHMTSPEKHFVARSDVHSAVFHSLAFATGAIVGTVVVLNSLGIVPT